jgi:DNA-binding response OmpR family regulator
MDRHPHARQRHALLLVEDHDATRRILAKLLQRKGYEVRTAATVSEGLDSLDPEPDCLILDLMLPDGEGEAVLRRVRDRGLRTRVVVTTATGDEARLERVRRLGPAALLRKPIEVEEVCRACDEDEP